MTSASPVSPVLHPVAEHERIDSVDVLRGVAVLGILLLNIVGMSMPDPAYHLPSAWGGATGWNLRVWWINELCFEGAMRALFTLLFGAGVLLFTGKGDEKQAGISVADAWYRRTIWLFLFGLVHAYFLLWPGEVLYWYGLLGLFLFPLRRSSPARLASLAALLLAAGVAFQVRDFLVLHHLRAEAEAAAGLVQRGDPVPAALAEARKNWEAKRDEWFPPLAAREKYVAAMQGGYANAFRQRAETTFASHSVAYYRYSYFDSLSLMLLGMALLKWNVLQARCSTRTYVAMIATGYGLGLAVNTYESALLSGSGFDSVTLQQSQITYHLGRLAIGAGHIGVVMLVCQFGLLGRLRRALAATGRMALTNYVTQTIITSAVFVGFAQFGRWERHELYYLVAGIWCFQLVASPLWLRRFHFGPLEWLWRSLTYLQRQPFRRATPLATPIRAPASDYGLPSVRP